MSSSPRRRLGEQFAWLWRAYAVSAFGTSLAFGAFPIIAILVLDSGPAEVSALAAVGLAVGAAAAVPLGPWIEFRRKRPVMVAMDLTRFAASLTIPLAFAFGVLTFAQLLVVAVIVSAADIAFKSASGALLKSLVDPDDLLVANGRLEAVMWTTIALGPPLGGALIGAFGPVTTVIADAASYVLSALGLTRIRDGKPAPAPPKPSRRFYAYSGEASRSARAAGALEGWRVILAHPTLRPLFFTDVLFKGLLLATEPLLSVLMLGQLGFSPWEYGLALAGPCIGGLIGSRSAHRIVDRFGQRRTMLAAGTLRVVWPLGLAFIPAGVGGLAMVFALQFALVTCLGVFVPAFSTYRLQQTGDDVVVRTLSAWSLTGNVAVAVLTVLWGLLAAATSARFAIGAAGVFLLFTPALMPWRRVSHSSLRASEAAPRRI